MITAKIHEGNNEAYHHPPVSETRVTSDPIILFSTGNICSVKEFVVIENDNLSGGEELVASAAGTSAGSPR